MRKRFLTIALGLLSGTLVFFRGEVIRASTDPGTELLSVQIFWVDPGDPPAPDNVPGRYDLYRYRILAEEEPGGWRDGAGRALVVVPGAGGGRENYALSRVRRISDRRPGFEVESVIGSRSRSRFGMINTLNLNRVAALPDFAQDGLREMIELRALEGKVYWEAVFKLTHLRREEVVWVDAMGPALIKPPRKWLDIFRRPGSAPEPGQGAADGSCLGLGLLNLCINMPKMVRSLNKRLYPLERSRVRVTHSLWDAGESCGVVVVGKLLDYSMLTFRVRTNGKGNFSAGVRYLQPFNLSEAAGWFGSGIEPPPEPAGDKPENRWIRKKASRRHHRAGRLVLSSDPWGPPRLAKPLPFTLEEILERARSAERK